MCGLTGFQVSLDLGIAFINSNSMTEGPLPSRMHLCKVEDSACTQVVRCEVSPQTFCDPSPGFSSNVDSLNGLNALLITIDALSIEDTGTYTATADIEGPSGITRTLTQTSELHNS